MATAYTVNKWFPSEPGKGEWRYWTDKGEWSSDIKEAKTWAGNSIRFADKIAAKTIGALVCGHAV